MDTTRNRKRCAETPVHEVECIERNCIQRLLIPSSSHLPPEQGVSVPVTGPGITHCKTWKKYVLAEGLINEETIDREVKAFPFTSRRAQDYKNNLKSTLATFEEFIVEGFHLQDIVDTVVKAQPPEARIKNCEAENENTLKRLSGNNCIVRDASDKR